MATDKLNLLPAIYGIEAQIRELTAEFNHKIKPYQDSLKALREINEVCEKCGGTGRILRSRSCAEDDPPDPNDPNDYNICPVCHGTGLSKKSE